MADHIWIVRAPDGRVIGASVRSEASAILDTLGHCGSTTRTHMGRLQRHVELQGVPQNSYEKDGYTLTREPLTPALSVVSVTDEMVEAAWAKIEESCVVEVYDEARVATDVTIVDIHAALRAAIGVRG